jgi:hypothetical protein
MLGDIYIYIVLILSANLLTIPAFSAGKLQIPPCPAGSERIFMPDEHNPTWAACKDEGGLYQGLLIQLTGQQEIMRVAGVKNSLREGREMRFGLSGTLEERNFKAGHLNGKSFIFSSNATLARAFPAKATFTDWQVFSQNSDTSELKVWLKQEPETTIEFVDGRLSHLQFANGDYHFKISKDGRMFALDHKEMKNLFFIDPEPLWSLNAADLKLALLPGFGSCKKYSGPIGRFGRHYDHLLYRREPSEKKHLDILNEIRDRFINFCVPEDIRTHLGRLECPPQLPSTTPPQYCSIPVSDQLHIPYEPKYFSYEFTLGRAPDVLHEIFHEHGMDKFASSYTSFEDILKVTEKVPIQVKRTPNGIVFRPLERDKLGRIKIKKSSPGEGNKDWYEWKRVPGY